VHRKTIQVLRVAGHDTLARIASANLIQMESDMEHYFKHTRGTSWQNYRSVIIIMTLVTCAKALPVIVDE
jgi:hypothetical protein